MSSDTDPGTILLADLDPVAGREQGGYRPVLAVAGRRYAIIPDLILVVPLTTTDRALPHHVLIRPDDENGLKRDSYAMTEQVRVLSYERFDRVLGRASGRVMDDVSRYLHLFIA